MVPLARLGAAVQDALTNLSAPGHAIKMPLYRLGATPALTLLLAAAMACSSQGATETSSTAPIQASSPTANPVTEPIAETSEPRSNAPSNVQPANMTWRLSSKDNGPFKAGEELSLTLDLDPQNLGVSGIQFSLNYPGELLRLREIVPGGILGRDPIVVEKVDGSDSSPAQGQERILFAMARRGDTVAPTGPGRVALIKMLTLQEIPENGNVMIWLDRVKLTGEKFQTIGPDSVSWSLSGPD